MAQYHFLNLALRASSSSSDICAGAPSSFFYFLNIGHLKMDKISPIQIQKFVKSLLKGDAKNRALSPKTAKNYLAFVSSVFAYAIQMRVVK